MRMGLRLVYGDGRQAGKSINTQASAVNSQTVWLIRSVLLHLSSIMAAYLPGEQPLVLPRSHGPFQTSQATDVACSVFVWESNAQATHL